MKPNQFALDLQAWLNARTDKTSNTTDEALAYIIQLAAIIASQVVHRGEDPETAQRVVCHVLRGRVVRAIEIARQVKTAHAHGGN